MKIPKSDLGFLPIGSKITDLTHCNEHVKAEPVVIPPTWNKVHYYKSLSYGWERAAKELSEAENIFIIGYSLPESDLFFRYLYALGTVGKAPLKKFYVINPDGSNEIENRFNKLLGPGAIQRFKYFPLTFEHGISEISNAIFSSYSL